MKISLGLTTVVTCLMIFGSVVTCFSQHAGEPVSVLKQDVSSLALSHQELVQPSILFEPEIHPPHPGYGIEHMPSISTHPTVMHYPMVAGGVVNSCCQKNNRKKCRCPKPAPVAMELCLVDPCGCSHVACVEVPVCCLGEQPEISWRQGVRGRQIATLCWNCCDHQVKVIITGVGKVRTRD